MEVIARQSEKAKSSNIIFAGMGGMGILGDIILLIFLVNVGVFPSKDIVESIVYVLIILAILAVSLFFLLLGLKLWLRYSKLPIELIKYENGEIVFADGYRCKPSDIVDVDCFKVERDGTPQMKALNANPDGWINITTKDKIIKYQQVEKVRDAYDRLMYYKQNFTDEETDKLSKNIF